MDGDARAPGNAGRIVVVGLGNPLRRDEGVAVRVVERLAAEAGTEPGGVGTDGVLYLDLGTAGMRLLDAVDGARKVVVVDCAYMGRAPGAIVRFTPAAVRSRKPAAGPGLHNGDVLEVLALARRLRLRLPVIVVLGIEPASVEPGLGLTETVAAGMDGYVRAVRRELAGPAQRAAATGATSAGTARGAPKAARRRDGGR